MTAATHPKTVYERKDDSVQETVDGAGLRRERTLECSTEVGWTYMVVKCKYRLRMPTFQLTRWRINMEDPTLSRDETAVPIGMLVLYLSTVI